MRGRSPEAELEDQPEALGVGVLRLEAVLVLDHAAPERHTPDHGRALRPAEGLQVVGACGGRRCTWRRAPRAGATCAGCFDHLARAPGPGAPRDRAQEQPGAVSSPRERPGAPRQHRLGGDLDLRGRGWRPARSCRSAIRGRRRLGLDPGLVGHGAWLGDRRKIARHRQGRGLDLDDALGLPDVHGIEGTLEARFVEPRVGGSAAGATGGRAGRRRCGR